MHLEDEKYEIVGDPIRTIADIIEYFYDIIFIEELKQLYVWTLGVYRYKGDEWLNSLITSICRGREDDKANLDFKNSYKYNVGLVRNVGGLIKGDCLISQEKFIYYHELINCKNGVFSFATLKFTKHEIINPYKKRGYYPFIQLPINYNPKATCPKTDKFIKEIFGKKWREIYEVIGSYITTDVSYQKEQWLYGFGSNGKGVFSKLVKQLLGRENIQVMSMKELLKDYSLAELQNKLLNIIHDIDVDEIGNTGLLKSLTGSDDLNARKKYIQKQISFENTCKLLIACNTIPKSKDDTYAWWRRKMLYPLTKTFTGKHRDLYLIKKLTTEKELEGLLNRAINGLHRLRWRGGFIDEDIEAIREKWFLESDPLGKFILHECDQVGDCLRKVFVDEFNIWRKNNNMPKVYERYVTQHLRKKMPMIELKRKRGVIPAKYIGISLRNGQAQQINVNDLFMIPKKKLEDDLDEF